MKYINFTLLVLITIFFRLIKTEFIYSCTEDKTIALTFDDGPHRYTKDLVDYIVDLKDVRVTFFHVGKFHYPYATDVIEYQDAMKKAHDNGLQIASHTFKHEISSIAEEFKQSLTEMDDFIEKVTGDRPRYFRAPKGHCDETCQKNLKEWDYRLIQWDVDTNDWDIETSGSIEQRVEDSIEILKKKFSEEKSNYLILMHDSQNYTVSEIVPWILEKSGMKEKGYRFVTVAECLGDISSMYKSGKSYGNYGPPNISRPYPYYSGNDTNLNSLEGIYDASEIYIEHDISFGTNLESAAIISSKPINSKFYLFIGLLLSFIFLFL